MKSAHLRRSIGAIDGDNIVVLAVATVADKVLTSSGGEFLQGQNRGEIIPFGDGMGDGTDQQCGGHDGDDVKEKSILRGEEGKGKEEEKKNRQDVRDIQRGKSG